MYADDTVLTYNAPNKDDLFANMQNDLKIIERWLTNNDLSLNADKSHFMIFKNHNFSYDNLLFNNQIITEVNTYKYLGLTIDNKLKWSDHLLHIRKKFLIYLCIK